MVYYVVPGTTNPSYGVYIQGTNGYYYTTEEWAKVTGVTANGVAVITEECSFVMALEDASLRTRTWSDSNTVVSGAVATESNSEAVLDYAGSSNTTAIITELGAESAQAANYCSSYVFPDTSKIPYMGAAGEWNAVLKNKSAIEEALNACGGDSMLMLYWTSTQSNSEYCWALHVSYEFIGAYKRSEGIWVRAFCKL